MYKEILIASDWSAHSQRALDCAKNLARHYAAQLILVHAFHRIPKEWGSPFFERAAVQALSAAEKVTQEAQSKLGDTTLQVVTEVLEGPRTIAGRLHEAIPTKSCLTGKPLLRCSEP